MSESTDPIVHMYEWKYRSNCTYVWVKV